MIFRWFYTSASRLPEEEASELAREIAKESSARNRSLGVTGALLFTGRYFAQYLEGAKESVSELRLSILDDLRHEEVRTIAEGEYPHRLFVNWTLAFLAPPQALAARAEDLLMAARAGEHGSADALAQFLCQTCGKERT